MKLNASFTVMFGSAFVYVYMHGERKIQYYAFDHLMTPSHTASAAAFVGKALSATGTKPYPPLWSSVNGPKAIGNLPAYPIEILGPCQYIPL